jgi:hypothetical protein
VVGHEADAGTLMAAWHEEPRKRCPYCGVVIKASSTTCRAHAQLLRSDPNSVSANSLDKSVEDGGK